MVAEDLGPMERVRKVVEVPAQRVRHRLGLVVVVEAGEIAPAGVAAHLDEARAELEPEHEPAREVDERERGGGPGRAEEDREEPRLEEERFPAEAVEGPADI